MYKKILSFLLIFCMLYGTMPMSAFAAESGNEEEVVSFSEIAGDETVQPDASKGDVSLQDVSPQDVSQGDVSQNISVMEDDTVGDMPGNGVVILATEDSDTVFEYSLDKYENATITKYQGNVSALNIPDTLDGYSVVGIGSRVFRNNSQLRMVVIPDSVTEIGTNAFDNCTNLSSVKLSKNLKSMGYAAFKDCDLLTEIEIPKNLESAGNDAGGAFDSCDGLKNVSFEQGTTRIASHLFHNCPGLEQIEIPNTVTEIQYRAFYGCKNLREVTIPDSVTKIGNYAFRSCTALKEIVISDSVIEIGNYAFGSCTGLKEIVIPDSVIVIGDSAFSNCSNLSSVKLSKSLKSIGHEAFYDCDLLTEIEIPKSLESGGDEVGGAFEECDGLKNVSFEQGTTRIAYFLFDHCPGLEQIEIPDTVTEIQRRAFYNCKNLKEVTIPDSVIKIGNNAFQICISLEEIVIPDSVTEIGYDAFMNCTNLSSVKLSKNLKSMGYDAFYNCDLLSEIEIPKSLESAGNDVGGAFEECDGLKNVSFEQGTTRIASCLFNSCPGLEQIVIPDTVTEIQYKAFYDCKNLKEVTIPDSVIIIGNRAFRGCISLEEIVIPDSVTEIGYDAFRNCTGLKEIVVPDSVTTIGTNMFSGCTKLEKAVLCKSCVTIPTGTFEDCSSLKTFELPDSVKTIQANAFQNCASLETFTIGENSVLQKVDSRGFQGCKALTGIALPDSVTSLGTYVFAECDNLADVTLGTGITTIPTYAFNLCGSLEKIVIPYRVTTINSNAFTNCTKLTEVSIPRATTSIASSVFSYPTKMTIYGVSGTYAETYAATIGATFVGREVPVTAMEFIEKEIKLPKGTSKDLILKITPMDFTDTITWRSSDTSIVTVTDGKVKAVAAGTVQITALAGDSGAVRAVCEVEVVQPVTSISLNKTTLTLEGGETFELVATVNPDTAYDKSIEWSSSDENVVTVTQDGVVTAIQKGTATITVTALDGTNVTKTCKVTVNSTAHLVESVEEIQSEHPYANNTNEVWIYTLAGAERISVSFSSDTETDEGYDFIYIYDGNGNEIGKYTGTELAGKTVVLDGGTVKIRLVSDDAITAYGFQVTSIIPGGQQSGEEQPGDQTTVSAPTASVPSGEVSLGTKVELATKTEGASIYYTLDGSVPNRQSALYKIAIEIKEDTTVKAFAVKDGFLDSGTATFTYTIPMLTVTFDSNGGSAVAPVTVAKGGYIKEPAAPVKEDYQFAGWYLNGTPFNFKTPVTENMVLVAQWKERDALDMPTANLPSGMLLEKGTQIKLSHTEPGVTIYYTLDGTEPTTASNIYRTAIVVNEEMTIKAFAVKDGFKDSAVATFHYTVAEKGSLWGDVNPEDIPAGGIPEGMWIAGVEDAAYTGKAIKPEIRVYDYKTLLVEKKDYTVSYKNNTNAADKDAAKAPSVIVTGKGNYGSKTTVTFNILPVDISEDNPAVISDDLTTAYTGKKQQPIPVVTVDGKKLANKKNYTLQYPSSKEGAYVQPDTYEICIAGTGNYSGERTISFTITDAVPMSKVKVTSIKAQTYTGEAIEPALTVKNGKETLVEGTDYLLTYENNVEIGTASAILEGIGDYSGIRRVSFKIAGQAISKAKVTNLNALTYNGEEQTQNPSLSIKVNGAETPLYENQDYTVTYQKNTNAGTATVIFTGINGYSGTLKKTFKINAYDLKNDSSNRFVIENGMTAAYAKGGATPKPVITFDGVALTEGKDYTLKYSNNKQIASAGDAKAPTVTVTGKGNFKGSRPLSFSIVKQDISNLTLDAADKVYQDKVNIYSTKVAVVDTDGKKLAAKKDYEAAITYTYANRTTVKDASGTEVVRAAGEAVDAADIIPVDTVINVKVQANEAGCYTGELTGSYRFVNADISKAKVTVKPQTYTGEAIEPGKDQITVTLQGQNLPNDAYEIVSYTNNVKKGKATIVIKGVGNYGGTKSVKFNIQSKVIGFLWW